MPEVVKKRCAIYTRKSVDEGLEQEFNSLDAQREAGEAFVLSQKANGWICMPEHYDDGGFSSGNMNRPALRKLLNDCEAGLIDIIIVYKLDRLSRSICDFADLTKKFDEWGVQFVSVTQEINTATSAGRMMLNILITFAQYEREIITERVRDKMSASRKKGKWVGGVVPMGYRVENKHLVVEPAEAEVIRKIFQRYVEIQSPKLIAMELNEQGIRTKQGKKWNSPHVLRILSSHTYVGEVKFHDAVCKGEQDAIITPEVWNRTKTIRENASPYPDYAKRQETIAPLRNLLRCGHCGGAMIPTYTLKRGRRYYYYCCSQDKKRAVSECPVREITSGDIEDLVKKQVQKMLGDISLVMQFAEKSGLNPVEVVEFFRDELWDEITPGEFNRLLVLLVEKAVVWKDKLEIEFKTGGIKSMMEELKNG